MKEHEEPGKDDSRRSPSGLVSSPRAYFGRASRAAARALHAGIGESQEAAASAPKRASVFRAGDPAPRLFAGFVLPMSPTTPLIGAIATLHDIRDGEHEKLFIDLGTSLVRSAPRRDDKAGTLSIVLSRTQSAETYSALLASLRYVNDAPLLSAGSRRIVLQIFDAGGKTRDVATFRFGVGDAPPEDKAKQDPRGAPGVVLGESLAFNSDGDYTMYWWQSRLPSPEQPAPRAAPAEPTSDTPADSLFSAGGTVYQLFEAPAERAAPRQPATPLVRPIPLRAARPPSAPALPPPAAAAVAAQTPPAANDRAPAPPPAANDAGQVAARRAARFGSAGTRMLRLEDIFGSDLSDAFARRIIDQRLASSGG